MIFYWVIPFGAAVALAVYTSQFYDRPIDKVQSWLLAMTAVTFITFAYDKLIAKINERRKKQKQKTILRAPELLLLALTFFGGTPGALMAIFFVDHKTTKVSFQLKFWVTVVLQILTIAACYKYFWRGF